MNTTTHDEWVEIQQPSSQEKIYANLKHGLCAKQPPPGSHVRKVEEYSDHWWELYDQKTGKLYYYNPEKQKTVWNRPDETEGSNGDLQNGRKLLIIPASKLQTFKKLREPVREKCDASTQTETSKSCSTGTQTSDDDIAQKNNLQPHRSSFGKSNNVSQDIKSKINSLNESFNRVNLNESLNKPPPTERRKILKPPMFEQASISNNEQNCNNNMLKRLVETNPPLIVGEKEKYKKDTDTKNLKDFIIKEAQAVGVALVADDQYEDDDDEFLSEDDYACEDEESDFREDSSSQINRHISSFRDITGSQDGCKSTIDDDLSESIAREVDSDERALNSSRLSHLSHINVPMEQPLSLSHLLENDNDNNQVVSQQLTHQKLVDNFKKTRQTSSFGQTSKVSIKPEEISNNTRNVRKNLNSLQQWSYNNNEDNRNNERLMREVSTLSTLPRPYKGAKLNMAALSRPSLGYDGDPQLDADYDLVEENCGYYSDSENFKSHLGCSNLSQKSNELYDKSFESNESDITTSFLNQEKLASGSTFSVESFAKENLSRHPKKSGLLFSRKVKWSRMIKWTENSIKQPMIASIGSDLNSDAVASFKLIQQFMGDRKITMTKKLRQALAQSEENQLKQQALKTSSSSLHINSNLASTSNINIPDKLRDETAFELVVKGCSRSALRDEIFVQLARQLTENPNSQSVEWGLVLISLLLSYFSPSSKFVPFFLSFLENHPHPMAIEVCLSRLTKRLRQNLTYCRKPTDAREISIVRLSITKWPQYCGVFGESLERILQLQQCSPYLKTLQLPWILTTFSQRLIELGGAETEGIFRCAADYDLIAQLRLEIDCIDFRKIKQASQVQSLLSNVQDPHVIAGLLKLYFRQLPEPVFPTNFYDNCLSVSADAKQSCQLVDSLPNLNRNVVAHLIRLLQKLSNPNVVAQTKMDDSNLSMVWAPNLLKAPDVIQEAQNGSKWSISNFSDANHSELTSGSIDRQTSPTKIFEQTRQEMQYIRHLIKHLETEFIQNVL